MPDATRRPLKLRPKFRLKLRLAPTVDLLYFRSAPAKPAVFPSQKRGAHLIAVRGFVDLVGGELFEVGPDAIARTETPRLSKVVERRMGVFRYPALHGASW